MPQQLTKELIESNILSHYGIDNDALYSNAHGREKGIVTNVRYVYWYILHYQFGLSATQISRQFNKCRRLVYRGIGVVKYCVTYDKYYIDIYDNITKRTGE